MCVFYAEWTPLAAIITAYLHTSADYMEHIGDLLYHRLVIIDAVFIFSGYPSCAYFPSEKALDTPCID